MAVSLPFSFKPAFDVEPDTYDKDGGGMHPSIKFNQKPLTVVSGKDAVHYRTGSSFATDLEAGETARLEAQQERNAKGGLQTLLSWFREFLLKQARRFGPLACPGCAFNSAE